MQILAGVTETTWIDILLERAQVLDQQVAYRYLRFGKAGMTTDAITFADLVQRAKAIGAVLSAKQAKGKRVIIVYPSGLGFIEAFFGVMFAGAVAVPLQHQQAGQRALFMGRLKRILADTGANLVISDQDPDIEGVTWIDTCTISSQHVGAWQHPATRIEDLAFLQYTSGSTRDPKGVCITHANLSANCRAIQAAGFGADSTDTLVSWMPHYHDMGLVGSQLCSLYVGMTSNIMSPQSFVRDPMRWLEAISKFGATTSGGPGFAYDLVLKHSSPERFDGLDLSRWRVAYCGAEPIRDSVLKRFAETFAPYGFDKQAFLPCYGMAETTLFVTGCHGRDSLSVDSEALSTGQVVLNDQASATTDLVSCGRTFDETQVRIVDPATQVEQEQDQVGEIWVKGPSVALGYLGDNATETPFNHSLAGESGFLRTGDLGFMHAGDLYVCGRLKDLIIIRGRNLYPQDIETRIQESNPWIHPNSVVAFGIDGVDKTESERLVVIIGARSLHSEKFVPLIADTRALIVDEFDITPFQIVVVRSSQIPRTSSGKVRRSSCRSLWQQDAFHVFERESQADYTQRAPHRQESFHTAQITGNKQALPLASQQPTHSLELKGWLIKTVAGLLDVDSGAIAPDESLTRLGLDSLGHLNLGAALEQYLETPIPVDISREYKTIDALVAHFESPQAKTDHQPAGASPDLAHLGKTVSGTPATIMQQRFLQHVLGTPGRTWDAHFEAVLPGELDREALHAAVEYLVAKHDSLRTGFKLHHDQYVLFELPADQLPQPIETVENIQGDIHACIYETIQHWRHQVSHPTHPLDPGKPPLWRIGLFKGAKDNDVTLVWWLQHVICDGWSANVLRREFIECYDALRTQQPLDKVKQLPPSSFTSIAAREARLLASDEASRRLDWWKHRSSTAAIASNPYPQAPIERAFIGRPLDVTFKQRLQKTAQCHGHTLGTLLLTVFSQLSGRRDGDGYIVTRYHNRTAYAEQNIIGCVYDGLLLPRRTEQLTLPHALQQTETDFNNARNHYYLPLHYLIKQLPQNNEIFSNTQSLGPTLNILPFTEKTSTWAEVETMAKSPLHNASPWAGLVLRVWLLRDGIGLVLTFDATLGEDWGEAYLDEFVSMLNDVAENDQAMMMRRHSDISVLPRYSPCDETRSLLAGQERQAYAARR